MDSESADCVICGEGLAFHALCLSFSFVTVSDPVLVVYPYTLGMFVSYERGYFKQAVSC